LGDSEDKKAEITVKAPSKSVIAPEKKAERAAERALEEERYNVLQVPKKVGKYLGLSSIILGAVLFVLLAYGNLTGQSGLIFMSASSSLPLVGLWIVVGSVSVVAGFLLIGSE
jgi:vacuolar-type H+-ATPase subunit F/Vma7